MYTFGVYEYIMKYFKMIQLYIKCRQLFHNEKCKNRDTIQHNAQTYIKVMEQS